jgi:hypothetical protein
MNARRLAARREHGGLSPDTLMAFSGVILENLDAIVASIAPWCRRATALCDAWKVLSAVA